MSNVALSDRKHPFDRFHGNHTLILFDYKLVVKMGERKSFLVGTCHLHGDVDCGKMPRLGADGVLYATMPSS